MGGNRGKGGLQLITGKRIVRKGGWGGGRGEVRKG